MSTSIMVALAAAIPLILLPVVFIWFLDVSGLLTVFKVSRAREKRWAKARRATLEH